MNNRNKTNRYSLIKKISFSILLICCLPQVIVANAKDNGEKLRSCPQSLDKALELIQIGVSQNKWIRINHADCPNIQSEIIRLADRIVQSPNFEDYIPLMDRPTLRLVRNTFFALRGYQFSDKTLRRHFEQYTWYHPSESQTPQFNQIEKSRINMLKKIADNWDKGFFYESQPLPKNARILEKKKTRVLHLGKSALDITPSSRKYDSASEQTYELNFAIQGVASWNTVLVCSQELPGGIDLVITREINMYSANGVKLHTYTGNIGGVLCPFWLPQRPDILLSYNKAGCCGAVWDILVTFNRNLEPVSVINCQEGGCVGTDLFYELSKGELYLYVDAGPTLFKVTKENSYSFFDYEQTWGKEGPYINALWSIERDGHVKLVSEIKKSCRNIPVDDSNTRWEEVVCDSTEPIIDLYLSRQFYTGEIMTSMKIEEDKLILFQGRGGENSGTTIIPLLKQRIVQQKNQPDW